MYLNTKDVEEEGIWVLVTDEKNNSGYRILCVVGEVVYASDSRTCFKKYKVEMEKFMKKKRSI